MSNIYLTIEKRRLGLNRGRINLRISHFLDDKNAKSCRGNKTYPTPATARCCFLVSFSADRSLLASTHGDHSISIFNSHTGHLVKTLVGHVRTPWCITFHPYLPNILASGCLGGQVRVWDVKTNASSCFSPCDNHVVTSVAFHPYDDVLAIGSQNVLTLWDWQNAVVIRRFSTARMQEGVRTVKFHPLGDWLLTGVTNLPSERHSGPMFLEVPNRRRADDQRLVQTVSCVTLQSDRQDDNPDNDQPSTSSSSTNEQQDLDITASAAAAEDNSSSLPTDSNISSTAGTALINEDPILSAEIEADDRANPAQILSDERLSNNINQMLGTTVEASLLTTSREAPCLPPHSASSNVPYQSEMWNFSLGSVRGQARASEIGPSGDSEFDADDTANSIPVHSFISNPRRITHSYQVEGNAQLSTHSVATATARTSRHVHTAIVISSRDYNERQLALRTAVNRAIASAFAGNGEGAVACNIINTTQRLQLWHLRKKEMIDLKDTIKALEQVGSQKECVNVTRPIPVKTACLVCHDQILNVSVDMILESKNVVVAACKLHNDSSLDISADGTILATFLPSPLGFPDDGDLSIISLHPKTLGQRLYKRRYGPNAVSVSLSPSKRYALVGLASKRLMWQIMNKQLMGQVVKLPVDTEKPVLDDREKPVFSVIHECDRRERYHISVNTARFHPLPGNGFYYGTNRGHIQHCQIQSPTDSGQSNEAASCQMDIT